MICPHCNVAIAPAPKRTCPDCGGPARGRGYSHLESCPTQIEPVRVVKTAFDVSVGVYA